MSDEHLVREKNVIDILKIENLKEVYDGWQGACPVCRQENRDTAGDNLKIWKNSKFNCIADSYHNSSVLSLVGTKADGLMSHYFTPSEVKHEVETVYQESVLSKLVRNFDYWKSRGVSHETMAQFEGGVAIDGKMKDRWVLPLRNSKKQIIAFSGRYVKPIKDGIPKWRHLGKISHVIFPHFSEPHKKLVILESPGDCIACFQAGIKNVRVMFGIKLSSALMSHIISQNPEQIIISTNDDSSKNFVGNRAAERIKDQLSPFFDESMILIRLPKTGKDWGEASKEEIEEFRKEIYGN